MAAAAIASRRRCSAALTAVAAGGREVNVTDRGLNG